MSKTLRSSVVALLPVLFWVFAACGEPPVEAALVVAARGGDQFEAGPVEVDVFHPERDEKVEPKRGGTVTVYVPTSVTTLALPLRNSTYTRNILNEVHEMLVRRDWETWEFKGVLAKGWDTEDTLVLKEDERLFGKLTDLGEHWLVTPVSPSHPLTSPRRVKKADTESIELGTVLTFHLREDVKWHDGHAFDAGDVVFSWDIYNNPEIKCDSYRSNFQKIERADRIDDYTVRFHYTEQYHKALDLFRNMACLPSHLYNLLDSDHPDHDPKADEAALAEAVNENPHNSNWIGLGPYRIVSADPKLHVAERFEDYFDPENAGWVDRIRWRHIAGWDTALEALKNGELDYSAWLSSDMYFGEVTSDQRFTDNFYKGKYTTGSVAFTAWNMRRPHLSDVRVRKALCHAFDMEAYRTQQCKGLGVIPTGTQATFSPAYNRDVLPLKYDPEKAIGLLAEAGWYDRDGDGVADKDGVPLQIKYLAQANHKGDAKFTELLKQSYDKIGVDLQVTAIDFSTIIQRLKARDFDAVSSSWSLPLESNQNQLWHSENDQPGRENYSGVRDPKVDAWLEQGDREIDTEKRYAIWKEMQRYLYEDVQPYLFRNTPPKRFAMNKKFRGFQAFALVPGYSVRRWYLAE